MTLLAEYRDARRDEDVARLRRVIALRAMVATGMSQQQVGDALGISQPAVSQQLRYAPELLTDRWLRDTQRIADLLLAHPRGDHRAKRNDTTQPRDILVASRIPILRQQGHKTILSLSPCPVESLILALRIRKRGTVSIFGGTSADLQQRTPLGRTPLEFDIWGNEVGDVRGSI